MCIVPWVESLMGQSEGMGDAGMKERLILLG